MDRIQFFFPDTEQYLTQFSVAIYLSFWVYCPRKDICIFHRISSLEIGDFMQNKDILAFGEVSSRIDGLNQLRRFIQNGLRSSKESNTTTTTS